MLVQNSNVDLGPEWLETMAVGSALLTTLFDLELFVFRPYS